MMKKVVATLFTVYSLSSAQIPLIPEPPVAVQPPPIAVQPPIIEPPIIEPPIIEPPITPPIVDPQPPIIEPPITPPQQPPLPIPIQPLPQPPIAQPPFGQIFGAFGQVCGEPHPDNVCQSINQITSDVLMGTPGLVKCEREFDCCPCQSIVCGTELGTGCNTLSIGTSGAFGIGDISINGRREGAQINVFGLEGAMSAVMTGKNIHKISSTGEMGLRNTNINVEIIKNFQMHCNAMGSCSSGKFEFIIPGPPPGYACNPAIEFPDFEIQEIICGGQASCENADITIRNNGCGRAIIRELQCTQLDSCNNAKFHLIGDVDINQCDLGPSGQTAHGLERCFTNLERLICPDINSCIGPEKRILRDPGNGFLMDCGGETSCAGSHVTIIISTDPTRGAIHTFDGFKFGGVGSGAGATITIQNNQLSAINIELIDCPTQNSCAGLTVYTGDRVTITEFKCAPGACNGCTYQKDEISPVYACDPNAAFNNPMFNGPQQPPQQPPVPPNVITIQPFNPAVPPGFVPVAP